MALNNLFDTLLDTYLAPRANKLDPGILLIASLIINSAASFATGITLLIISFRYAVYLLI